LTGGKGRGPIAKKQVSYSTRRLAIYSKEEKCTDHERKNELRKPERSNVGEAWGVRVLMTRGGGIGEVIVTKGISG